MQISNCQKNARGNRATGIDENRYITIKKKAIWLTAEEEEFIQFVKFHGIEQLAQSLRMIHDLALYHTDTPFDAEEKTALFDLKVLWEGLERMERET
jgi:hypothetical protein